VSSDYVVAALKRVAGRVEGNGESLGGYLCGLNKPAAPKGKLPALFRVEYTLTIGCNGDAAARLARFSGIDLVAFPDYVENLAVTPPPSYEILCCGTEGAELRVESGMTEPLEKGQSVRRSWPPKGRVAKMFGQKSRRRIVDFTDAGGAPLITARARKLLEPFGLEGVEVLPAKVKDHEGKVVKGEHWLFHVTLTRPYVDVGESDIEVIHELLWNAREIVIDERMVADKPAFFRVPGARYPWVFVRRDVADAMRAAKLTGFRTAPTYQYLYTVEGSGLPHIC
jgi:hypothetical protein